MVEFLSSLFICGLAAGLPGELMTGNFWVAGGVMCRTKDFPARMRGSLYFEGKLKSVTVIPAGAAGTIARRAFFEKRSCLLSSRISRCCSNTDPERISGHCPEALSGMTKKISPKGTGGCCRRSRRSSSTLPCEARRSFWLNPSSGQRGSQVRRPVHCGLRGCCRSQAV